MWTSVPRTNGCQLLPSQMQSVAYRISKMLLHTCSVFWFLLKWLVFLIFLVKSRAYSLSNIHWLLFVQKTLLSAVTDKWSGLTIICDIFRTSIRCIFLMVNDISPQEKKKLFRYQESILISLIFSSVRIYIHTHIYIHLLFHYDDVKYFKTIFPMLITHYIK